MPISHHHNRLNQLKPKHFDLPRQTRNKNNKLVNSLLKHTNLASTRLLPFFMNVGSCKHNPKINKSDLEQSMITITLNDQLAMSGVKLR
jgi:hypothetical protein